VQPGLRLIRPVERPEASHLTSLGLVGRLCHVRPFLDVSAECAAAFSTLVAQTAAAIVSLAP
jgi:hypothetical protein